MLENQIGGFLFVLMGCVFSIMGYLMYNLEPNYAVGIRLPWTLKDDNNWHKTHQLASKIWVIGGLIIIVTALFLSERISLFVTLSIIALMCLIPVVFSYRIYKANGV